MILTPTPLALSSVSWQHKFGHISKTTSFRLGIFVPLWSSAPVPLIPFVPATMALSAPSCNSFIILHYLVRLSTERAYQDSSCTGLINTIEESILGEIRGTNPQPSECSRLEMITCMSTFSHDGIFGPACWGGGCSPIPFHSTASILPPLLFFRPSTPPKQD